MRNLAAAVTCDPNNQNTDARSSDRWAETPSGCYTLSVTQEKWFDAEYKNFLRRIHSASGWQVGSEGVRDLCRDHGCTSPCSSHLPGVSTVKPGA